MFSNYLKIAWRKILQQKMYSLITISGLAVGLGIFLLFFALYQWKMNPDSFHKDIDRIYNVVQIVNTGSGERHTAYIPYPLAPSLKNDIPEIENFTRFYDSGRSIISYEDKKFYESQVLFVDPNFTSFFTFKIIEGNIETLLSNPNTVVISKRIAEKYFGNEPAVGKVLTLDNQLDLVVTGIFEDLDEQPTISSLYGQFLIPLEAAQNLYGSFDNWKDNYFSGFVRLQKGFDSRQIEAKLELSRSKYYDSSIDSPQRLYLFPTQGLVNTAPHISRFANYQPVTGIIAFFIIGFLFLLIGIFNYVNLSTARYTERLKELGVRKVVGARKSQLVKQFLTESVLSACIAFPFAIITYNLINSFIDSITPFKPPLNFLANDQIIFASIVISLLTGFFAGIYPSIYLSSFLPVQILRGKLKKGKTKSGMRKVLVIAQFSIAIIFVALTLTFKNQADFLNDADLGYNRSNVLVVPLSDETKDNYSVIKEKLNNYPGVINTAFSNGIPGNWQTKKQVIPEGMDANNSLEIYYYGIDYEFTKTMGMQLSSGRFFNKNFNEENTFIINELFARRLNWNSPIGKTIKVDEEIGTIVGIVNDFHFDNTFWPITPAAFYLEKTDPNYMLIRTKDRHNIAVVSEHLKTLWDEFSPNIPFNSFTLDEYFKRSNSDAWLMPKVLGILGLLAILYSCLGLLALATYAVRQRKKEISIRKVLGASVPVILTMLSKDFLKLILMANIIALPLAYFASNSLLDIVFSIHISIGIGILLITTFFTLLIAVIAITIQTFRAAYANPVDSLKYE